MPFGINPDKLAIDVNSHLALLEQKRHNIASEKLQSKQLDLSAAQASAKAANDYIQSVFKSRADKKALKEKNAAYIEGEKVKASADRAKGEQNWQQKVAELKFTAAGDEKKNEIDIWKEEQANARALLTDSRIKQEKDNDRRAKMKMQFWTNLANEMKGDGKNKDDFFAKEKGQTPKKGMLDLIPVPKNQQAIKIQMGKNFEPYVIMQEIDEKGQPVLNSKGKPIINFKPAFDLIDALGSPAPQRIGSITTNEDDEDPWNAFSE